MPYSPYYTLVLEDAVPAFQFMSGLFGSNLVEAWDSERGIALASGAVDTWTGQKLGIVLTAAASGNRPVYGADGSNFRSRNVVQGGATGPKYLRNTDFGFDLLPAVSSPYTLTILRTRANVTDKAILYWGSTASQFEFYPYEGTSGVSGVGVRTATVAKTVISADAYTSSVKMHEAWCDVSGINVRNNLGTTATTAGGTATTGALRKLSFFGDNGGGNPNDVSIRWHSIHSSKPSDALIAQALAYFQQDSGF